MDIKKEGRIKKVTVNFCFYPYFPHYILSGLNSITIDVSEYKKYNKTCCAL